MSGDLSEHFSAWEFECRCGCGRQEIDWGLLEGLEGIRKRVGAPVIVTSGVRCPEHNAAEGGATNSQHLYGRAADITWAGPLVDLFEAALEIRQFKEGGIKLAIGKNFVHVDVRGWRWRKVEV